MIVLRKGTRHERGEVFDLGANLDFGAQSAEGITQIVASGGGGGGSGDATSLQSIPIDATTPTTGQILTYDGSSWGPSGSTALAHPDDPPAVADAMDDEFNGLSALDAKWVHVGVPTLTYFADRIMISAGSNTGDNHRQIRQGGVAVGHKYRAKLSMMASDWDTNYWGSGLFLRDAVLDRFVFFGIGYINQLMLMTQYWTNNTTFGSNQLQMQVQFPATFNVYLEIELTGSDIVCRYSQDGFIYTEVWRANRTAWLSNTAAHVGFSVSTNHASITTYLAANYFRRVA